MPRRKTGSANGGQKSPAPRKGAKKMKKITRSVAAAAAKSAARSDSARRTFQLKGPKSTSLMLAYGKIKRGYELVLQHPKTGSLLEINGPAEEGAKGWTQCHCLTLKYSSCLKHPSREKVRTGHFIACPTKERPNKRRAVWVPKVLVEKGYVKTVPFEVDGRGRMRAGPYKCS